MRRRAKHAGSFLWSVWLRMENSHFGLISAGVAFYAMFALFPGLTATIAIWSLVSDPSVISSYVKVADEFLPHDAAVLVHDQITALITTPKVHLGWATLLSLGIAVYSARAGISALIQGLDVVHRATPRGLLQGWWVEFVMTMSLITTVLVALATVVIVPLVLNFVTLGVLEGWMLLALPWGAMVLLLMSCLIILYRFGPNTPQRRVHRVIPGAFLAALVWAMVSIALSAYLANFNSYNRIYGSIGAVIALLSWLYLSVWSVLLGAAVNAEIPYSRPH
ncbi:YihY/virulence factor BrkB family protein [Rhodobacter ferrooxidans]|uniref:Ribonuclease BN n=1 Tax=Rhodobacter ferrooxidans TaxID=371731 RepID=C8S147_9RHOB|nr:YihY/virulence factor BrkB family protein [Rhodobacter sp. SW2]EEW25245.1 ribonuclease BN [Rhodobacter sp. SW2]